MVNTYCLVNPYIKGEMKTKVKCKNSHEAANIFYKSLSEHFNNSVPKFMFTIQKGSSGEGSLYHFEVNEKRENDEVNYSIKIINNQVNSKTDLFKNKLDNLKNKFNHVGGEDSKKSKKDDSSDSDSDSDEKFYKIARKYILNKTSVPIYYWWYYPYLYPLESLYIPTFYPYITPYIELAL